MEEKLTRYKKINVKRITREFRFVLEYYYRNNELLNAFNTFMQKNEDKFIYYKKPIRVKKDKKKDKKDNHTIIESTFQLFTNFFKIK